MKETEVQAQIIDALWAAGYFVWRNNNMATYDPRAKRYRRFSKYGMLGVPDIVGICKDGRFIGIEVKTEKAKNNLSDHQKEFINNATKLGAISFCTYSVDHCFEILESYA